MDNINKAIDGIDNTLVICRNKEELHVAGHAIIEFCTAFGMTDSEIVTALSRSGGNSAMEDEFIDSMIFAIEDKA